MRRSFPRHLTFANVVSVIALFVALGGSSYAALRIGSAEIRNNSVRGNDIRNRTITHRDVKRDGLGGTNIKESRLGKVRRAANADRVGGATADQLKLRCPDGTKLVSGVCIERDPRPAAPYGAASVACDGANRRLPLHHELKEIVDDSDVPFAPDGELTAHVYPSSSTPGKVDVLTVVSKGGAVGLTPDTAAGAKAFRCVAYPSN